MAYRNVAAMFTVISSMGWGQPPAAFPSFIFFFKNLIILIQIKWILIAASFRFLKLLVRHSVHFLSGLTSALQVCVFVFCCINLYLMSNLREKA